MRVTKKQRKEFEKRIEYPELFETKNYLTNLALYRIYRIKEYLKYILEK